MEKEEITRNFDSYQSKSKTFLLGKFERMRKANLAKYCALGLCEESGEVAGKIKKSIRDADGKIDAERVEAIILEMGDVLWYLSIMAHALGVPFSYVAEKNIEKISDRWNRGVVHGEGDNR